MGFKKFAIIAGRASELGASKSPGAAHKGMSFFVHAKKGEKGKEVMATVGRIKLVESFIY